MLTIKYSKHFPSSMVSHIDMLRVMNRIFRRADIEVDYSKGFNPHMLIFFSPALSLGAESCTEFVSLAVEKMRDLSVDEINKFCPNGIVCIKTYITEKNPNLAAEIKWAKYTINANGIGKIDIDSILKRNKYEISYLEKGEQTTKDIRSYIKSIERIDDDCITATLACGNLNLKADRFACGIMNNANIEQSEIAIKKTEMYTDTMTADEFLNQLSQNINKNNV
ncbi:MAG: TIGR03936 family radical SAM-associated protein [Clostridia bacterium]